MKDLNGLWRSFYAAGIAAIAIQQLFCADFRPVMLPPGSEWLPDRLLCTWVFSILLLAVGVYIIFGIKARSVSIALGSLLLLMVLLFQLPYVLTNAPKVLANWTDPLKELTLSGGAFIVAGSLPEENVSAPTRFLAQLIPLGKYFMAVLLVVFGISHFIYKDFVATLVPGWIPGHIFWTYFAGAALIAGGLGIGWGIKRKLAAGLTGLMIFIWLIILHIPRAIADPHSGNGNEWTSVFEALAFSGIAFLICSKSSSAATRKAS